MTKTLTEQWREGTLPDGFYYMKDYAGGYNYRYLLGVKPDADFVKFFKEVLAPVPSYEEYDELLRHSELSRNLVYEVLVNQKEYNELLDKAKENKRLQEQLEEANVVITSYIRNNPLEKYGPAEAYCERWQVK